jgi:hypothetical protein
VPCHRQKQSFSLIQISQYIRYTESGTNCRTIYILFSFCIFFPPENCYMLHTEYRELSQVHSKFVVTSVPQDLFRAKLRLCDHLMTRVDGYCPESSNVDGFFLEQCLLQGVA